jgi:circadian clock protein KaiC
MQRAEGYRRCLRSAGLYDPKLEVLNPERSSMALGGQLFQELLRSRPDTDAIFFCNDDIAQGGLLAALRLGVKVPEQVAIAGFNDLAGSDQMLPPLTTVHTPRSEIGEQAAQMLMKLMRKETPASSSVDLGYRLVVRAAPEGPRALRFPQGSCPRSASPEAVAFMRTLRIVRSVEVPPRRLSFRGNEMNPTSSGPAALERFPSGIPGLDVVLGGGFFRAGVYILQGLPGSGKTILANQVCYSHVAAGGSAVYMTLLAESHSRMLQHIRTLSFFDERAIPDRISYLSAFHDLETDGLKGLVAVLRREMRARRVGVLVLDGLVAAAEAAETDRELKKFIHEVQTSAVFHGCTVFLLTSGSMQRVNAEHTMVDGIVELEDRLYDARSERSVQVRKFRGAGSLRGKHAFRISDDGLQVFPRVEALFSDPPLAEAASACARVRRGLARCTAEGGRVAAASATVVVGSTGTGKTTLGLHFLSTPRRRSRAAVCLLRVACARAREGSCLRFRPRGAGGERGAEAAVASPGRACARRVAHRLLDEVQARGVKRLVIDGLSGFFESAVHPERSNRFFSCLANELRRRGVTVVMTLETRDVVGSTVSTPYGVSGFVDNLLFMRFVEERGKVRRLLVHHQDARQRLRHRRARVRDRGARHADCRSLHFGWRRHPFRRTDRRSPRCRSRR